MSKGIAKITKNDLKKAENLVLTEAQLKMLLGKTPPQYIRKRKAKGGGQWDYVSTAYMTKCLNLMFGWDWDFEIVSEIVNERQVIVKGKLTCRSQGSTITKMQYGRKDVAYLKEKDKNGNRIPMDVGNDLKAAASDALKKCASELGLAGDIYGKEDFKEVQVVEASPEEKEKERFIKWINNAETLDELQSINNQVYELGDESIIGKFELKIKELSK